MSSSKLTKAEIIEEIFEKSQVNRKVIHEILDLFFVSIKEGLSDDRVVELRGFGTFEIRTRKGREKARNPKTGDQVPVQSHGAAVFRPGKELKDMAWEIRS